MAVTLRGFVTAAHVWNCHRSTEAHASSLLETAHWNAVPWHGSHVLRCHFGGDRFGH